MILLLYSISKMIVDLANQASLLRHLWVQILWFFSAKSNSISVTDNRTNNSYLLRIENNAISATDFLFIKAREDPENPTDQNTRGLRIYDPGLRNTAVIKSNITFV